MLQQKEEFSAETFVQNLLTEGSKIGCDDTCENFNNTNNVTPPFFDNELFKKGQKFFHDNPFALLNGKLYGLLSVLLIPSILKILMLTNMSSSNLTAYRRYLATIFHMVVWYESDFQPGSKLWQSINDVKNRHNSASKKAIQNGLPQISQKDMALTQFGFFGFAVARSKLIGLHYVTDEDLRGFIHVWRVIGSIMGIEDRFNICRESIQETRSICNLLIENVFQKEMEKKDENFLKMASYFINGMWCMSPVLRFKVVINYLNVMLLHNSKSNNNNDFFQMTVGEKRRFNFMVFVLSVSMKFRIFQWYHNMTQVVSLWLMRNFPFLAYYMFGRQNAHVTVLSKNKDN